RRRRPCPSHLHLRHRRSPTSSRSAWSATPGDAAGGVRTIMGITARGRITGLAIMGRATTARVTMVTAIAAGDPKGPLGPLRFLRDPSIARRCDRPGALPELIQINVEIRRAVMLRRWPI